jgi:SAM-dependent methyltransferase
MTSLSQRLKNRYFASYDHPYDTFAARIAGFVDGDTTILDAGCGRTAPFLRRMMGKAKRLIGIDLVDFVEIPPAIECRKCDLAAIDLPDGCVDLVVSRAVMEHVVDPDSVYAEFARILRSDGRLVFLTANKWDYASLIARIVPNRLHPWIVSRTEGRSEVDVFPTAYRSNSRRAISRLAHRHGFIVEEFRYIGQYPSYFMFSGVLFLAATAYQKLIERWSFLHFLQGWIFVAMKKRETAPSAESRKAS